MTYYLITIATLFALAIIGGAMPERPDAKPPNKGVLTLLRIVILCWTVYLLAGQF